MSDLIWAIDPGNTTGWAWSKLPDRGAGEYPASTFLNFFWKTLKDGSVPDEVIIERFTITQQTVKNSQQQVAIEVIGTLKWMCAQLDVPVEFQQPADVMGLVPNARLKELGWYVVGQEHARDALRHLVYRLARRQDIKLTDVI